MGLLDDAAHWKGPLTEACAATVQVSRPPGTEEPVHTLYWGAHRFDGGTLQTIGEEARRVFQRYAETSASMTAAFGTPAEITADVHDAIARKLNAQPVEDLRIDFEDGYGVRPDAEETSTAETTARALAEAIGTRTAPPRTGIRIKALTPELLTRSVTTLERFVATLADATGGSIGDFVVTLPKVTVPEQLEALSDLLTRLELRLGLADRTIRTEFMVEVPGAVFDRDGALAFPALLSAAGPRLRGVHLGVYDYTAAHGIAAMYQGMDHPACHFVRGLMALAFGGRGIVVSAGSTHVLPVGPHPELPNLPSPAIIENRPIIHRAWHRSHDQIRDALRRGFTHGWDLHPAQLPARFAAVFGYYIEGADATAARMRQILEAGTGATDDAAVLDDVATGQALFELYRRGHGCGALDDKRLRNAGLSADDLAHPSYAALLAHRRQSAVR
jgi:citrate lyase beta subunit